MESALVHTLTMRSFQRTAHNGADMADLRGGKIIFVFEDFPHLLEGLTLLEVEPRNEWLVTSPYIGAVGIRGAFGDLGLARRRGHRGANVVSWTTLLILLSLPWSRAGTVGEIAIPATYPLSVLRSSPSD